MKNHVKYGTPVKLLRDITEKELKCGREDTISLHAGTKGKVTKDSVSFLEVLFDGQEFEWAIRHDDLEVIK
jgi:hypothetical protein